MKLELPWKQEQSANNEVQGPLPSNLLFYRASMFRFLKPQKNIFT